jgi:hypothetical protein
MFDDGFSDGKPLGELVGSTVGKELGNIEGAAITVTPEIKIPGGRFSNDSTNPSDSTTSVESKALNTAIST